MTACRVIRIDATYSPGVRAGDNVQKGQDLLVGTEAGVVCICPASGVVSEIRFDPDRHEFVISISPSGPA